MNLFGLNITRARAPEVAEAKESAISLNTLLRRLDERFSTSAKVAVTPETAMQAPTVHAIVTGLSRRIATLQIRVQRLTVSDGRKINEDLPKHWVNRLLNRPNDWQDRVSFWLDAASWLIRYGNCYWVKSQGSTGPVRNLVPVPAGEMSVEQDLETGDLHYRAKTGMDRRQMTWNPNRIVHARTGARDGVVGDSPIMDVREAIGLEIAAEKMGSEVFGNLAMPGPVFGFEEWSAGFKTDEERQKFIEEFQAAYGSGGRWRPMVLPRGMTLGDGPQIDNDKAQYLQLRQYQRSVIAGAFGVPLHLVGDLSKGTFNNVSEQNRDLIMNVILPYIQVFEAALERALLTDADRNSGVIIRFDLDAALRADFKTRQEGLKIRREMGTLTANEWREKEGDNPLPEGQGGDDVWRQGPSGQNAEPSGDKPPGDDPAANDDGQDDEEAAKRRAATVARIQLRAASNVRGGRVSRALAGLKTSIDQYTEKTP